ncbi:hypothetical protein [Pseudomonas sp. LS-2]|uniref:hypothetical protein n=1 Tax=Pseudomonas sp. LS-2 TaxID=2315859 RepID=UPI0015AEE68F|nr:hypothetical protein [Pseudomonas sp. LS-2]
MNIVMGRVPGHIEIYQEHEPSIGLSAIEMEAIGLPMEKACDLINEFLVGGVVGCRDSRQREALECLFKLANQEMEFQLHEIGNFNLSAPPCPDNSCIEMEARMLVFSAKQQRQVGLQCSPSTV